MKTPLTVETDIKDILNRMDQKLESLLDSLNDVRVNVATLNTKVDKLEEDVKEIKGSQRAQIWTLIGIISTALLGAIIRFVLIGLPNKMV
jgi:hypothetical protein